MAKDPVCGMEVDPKFAAGKTVHKGQTYYFCSPECKKTFEKNPEKYTMNPAGGGSEQQHQHQQHK